MDILSVASKITLARSFFDVLSDMNNDDQPLKDWMKENHTYKKDKLFQAWAWLAFPELYVRYNEYDYYKTLFATTRPTKKAISEVIDMAHYLPLLSQYS
jgi:predicted double-glycine peptidase